MNAEPWWKGAVIYQIYPRSFADSNDDGIGDLPGITNRLDYVAALGVDAIWLSPFFTSPMHDYGYDVADYCDVDPVFGTLDDFDALLRRAHELGLRVVIDQVYSHTSNVHPWFVDSRRRRDGDRADWYVWADARPDGSAPNNWLSVFGGPAWSWDTRRRQYYLHNFLAEQPDLNFHNPLVQEAILDVSRFWLARGVDGFRLDVANYYFHDPELRDNPPNGTLHNLRPYQFQRHVYNRSRPECPAFLERLRRLLDEHGDRMAVAEIFSASHTTRSIEYTRGSDRLHTAYNFFFLESSEPGPLLIRRAFDGWEDADAWPSWSFSNHDVRRVLTRWGHGSDSPALARMLVALLGCLRGTVFLYQGEELGLPQAEVPFEKLRDPEAIRFWPEHFGRDGCRTPMPWQARQPNGGFSTVEPWLPVDARHEALAVDLQQADERSTLSFARRFLLWRRRQPALRHGGIAFHHCDERVLIFERSYGGQRLLCGFNFSRESVTVGCAALPGAADRPPVEGMNATISAKQATLAPYGCFVIEGAQAAP